MNGSWRVLTVERNDGLESEGGGCPLRARLLVLNGLAEAVWEKNKTTVHRLEDKVQLYADCRGQLTGLLHEGLEFAQHELHDLLDVFDTGLVHFLIKVLVHKCHDWHYCFDGCRTLVIPQHFILLQASIDGLQEGIQNGLVEEICMLAQTAQVWV